VKHARYYWLLLAEGQLTRRLFGAMLDRIWALPANEVMTALYAVGANEGTAQDGSSVGGISGSRVGSPGFELLSPAFLACMTNRTRMVVQPDSDGCRILPICGQIGSVGSALVR